VSAGNGVLAADIGDLLGYSNMLDSERKVGERGETITIRVIEIG
jgi:hypothetical protein